MSDCTDRANFAGFRENLPPSAEFFQIRRSSHQLFALVAGVLACTKIHTNCLHRKTRKEHSDVDHATRNGSCQVKNTIGSRPIAQATPAAAGHKFVEFAEEVALSEDIAALFRKNPLAAEHAVRDMLFGFARAMLKPAFESPDDHAPSLTVAGKSYHQADVTRGCAMTKFGPVGLVQPCPALRSG
ncbi:MAG: hypothetical protein OXE94_01860 [Aestuariivita sp.]|nr:hypothetical protein [Aestuariivita sp.]MCY4202798.1 hypothetical protein [Aestuariivita sp.]